MRLDFNVLWVEDQPDRVAAQIVPISRAMEAEGFQLSRTMCNDLSDVERHLSEDLFRDEIDLILVDWELGGGVKGQDVIRKIRERITYKDIIFYSAVADINELRAAAYGEGLDGIYFVLRAELVEEVGQLFRSMIKKVLDLDHTRGIVMGATSDIDQTVRECLLAAHELLDGERKEDIRSQMLKLLNDRLPDLQDQLKNMKDFTVNQIMAKHQNFTANDGLRILVRILKTEDFRAHAHHVPSLNRYIQEVVPKRNILGHKVLSPAGKPQGIAGCEAEAVITLEQLRELRRTLLELRQKFRELHEGLRTRA